MSGWGKVLAALALGLLSAAYFVSWRAPAAGTFHDDAVYMVTAKALAEGKGYRIISLPNETPQTKFPVLFPLLLSAVWKVFPVFPANAPYLKLIPLAFALLWFVLVYRLLREEGASGRIALVLTLLTASSVWVIYLSTAVLSETLFAALITASLLWLRRAEKDGGTLWQVAVAGVFAALAFHTRSAALALLVAAPIALAFRRKWRHLLTFAVVACCLCFPWILWVALNKASASGVDAFHSQESYRSWNVLFGFTPVQKLHILTTNLLVTLAAPATLAGLPAHGLLLLPALVSGVCIAIGAWRHRAGTLSVFLASYIAVILLWAWVPTRFVVPVLPLLYWFGYRLVAERPRALVATGVVLCILSAAGLTRAVSRTVQLGDALPALRQEDSWYRLKTLLDWSARNTPPDAVLAGNLDPLYYLYTGRKAIRGFATEPYSLIYDQSESPIGTPRQVAAHLRAMRATYWIVSPNSSFLEGTYLERMQNELAAHDPQTFRRLGVSGTTSHDVLELIDSTAHVPHASLR